MQDMKTILDLVKAGRLQEATSAIQSGLSQGADPSTAPSRPMRDVTPNAEQLEGPAKRARRSRPAPASARPRKAPPRGTAGAGQTGQIPFRLHRPPRPDATAPLIVMLHGCTQTPEDFAAGTRMNTAADGVGAHVIWPEQLRRANPNGCWNWFDPAHQGRSGEAAALVTLIRSVAADVAPGASGIHVAGLSAGGAMAAILGAHYPETFASVGVHSGLPVGSARDIASAFAAMQSGGRARDMLPVPAIVFHGSADRTVAPANGAAVAETAPGGPRPRVATRTMGGRSTTVTRSDGPDGTPWRELWAVDGLGHAWSGGDASGSYADPLGPDATAEIMRFFCAVDRNARAD